MDGQALLAPLDKLTVGRIEAFIAPSDVRTWRQEHSQLGDWYGEVSPDGRDHWTVFLAKLDRMHREEPTFTPEDLAGIATPTLLMFADDDEVEFDHIGVMHRALPDAQLAIVTDTGHGLLADKPELCTMVIDFLTEPRRAADTSRGDSGER